MNSQKPIRSAGGMHDDYIEDHPAYAMIGASRVSSTPGAVLFGSDFLHGNYVVVRIVHASLKRGLSKDWVHGTEHIVEVALSEAQWATFLSTMNVGQGVPCTLQWVAGQDLTPRIEPDFTRREQFRAEVDDRLQGALASLDDLIATGKMSKADREKVEAARRAISGNLEWVAKSFDEHAEKTVEKAKIEVAAYVTGALQRAGLKSLGGDERPFLEMKEDE